MLLRRRPRVFGQLVAGDLVDELFLTMTPVATGGDATHILEANLPREARIRVDWLLGGRRRPFTRYRRA